VQGSRSWLLDDVAGWAVEMNDVRKGRIMLAIQAVMGSRIAYLWIFSLAKLHSATLTTRVPILEDNR
jgi:hypothetical protein